MEFKTIDKKSKKIVLSTIISSESSYEDDYGKNLCSKKGKKEIISLLKKNELFSSIDEKVIFVKKENEAMEGVDDLYYFSNDYENVNQILVEFIKSNFINENRSFVVYINQNDLKTVESCNNYKKVMYYNNELFTNYFNEESNQEEWTSCEDIRENYKLFANQQTDNNKQEEYNSTQDEFIYNEKTFENNQFYQNEDQSENQESSNYKSETEESFEQQSQEPAVDNDLAEDSAYVEENVEFEDINTEPKRDWYNDFYKLRGDNNNNIKSTADRFNLDKINKYEMIKEHCEKFDIHDLSTLRSNSSIKFGVKNNKNSTSYDKSKNKVEEQLKKLKKLNGKNESMLKTKSENNNSYLNSKKSSSEDIMNRINELKNKIG